MKTIKIFLLLFVLSFNVHGQANYLSTEFGYAVPVHTTATDPIRILFVFGEYTNNGYVCWPQGGVASEAANWIDPDYSTTPSGYITKYFYEASFGQYIVLGDYVDQVIPVQSYGDLTGLFAGLNALYTANNNSLPTHFGKVLNDNQNDFDYYTLASGVQGVEKIPAPDNGIDMIIFSVRESGGTGYGCHFDNFHMIGPWSVNNIGHFWNTGDKYGATFVIEEYLHAMYGYAYHMGPSAGIHTFASPSDGWGICGQYSSYVISNVVSGWDRNFLGWKNPNNTMLTSARDGVTGNEVDGALNFFTNPNSSTDGTYVLRDFVTEGDALQIKLPPFDYQQPGDKKNQYLWIENHQGVNYFDHDHNYFDPILKCLSPNACGDDWNKGILCQIQVGKDHKTDQVPPNWGDPVEDLISGGGKPNACQSWMMPLTAKGNYDFIFSPPVQDADPCNDGTPLADETNVDTKPNPLTGYSELYGIPNTDPVPHDNMIWGPGDVGAHSGYLYNGTAIWKRVKSGNQDMAFSCNGACPPQGKKILSLSTNPAPVPLYTYQGSGYRPLSTLDNWENRQIWLNGLSITLLEENYLPVTYGPDAVKIKVRWDDYDVENDVRWCGDIMLSANSTIVTDPSLHVINNSTILLDRGLSPTRMDAIVSINNEWVFTEPTFFTCLEQSFVNVESGSTIIVDNGSTLILKDQSKVVLQPNAQIIVRNNSKLILESGSLLQLENGARVIIEDGSTIEYNPSATIMLNGSLAVLEIAGLLDIKDYADFTFIYNTVAHGFVLFNSPLPLPLNIHAGLNCTMSFIGSTKNRKVLEVDQEGLYPPTNLISFLVQNGTVRLHPGDRILPLGLQTYVDFNSAKVSSHNGHYNGHLGLQLLGQYHNLTKSTFEYGKYGIHYVGTLGVNDLTATDCIFQDCDQGLYSDDKGVHLIRCNFHKNTIAGWNTGIMSKPSDALDGVVGGDALNANYLGYYYNSNNSSPLTLRNPMINFNNTSGVQIERTLMRASCGTISYNVNEGILLGKAATLQMDNGANVTCVNNAITIGLAQAFNFYLSKGNNDLTPLLPQSSTAVAGTIISGPGPIIADQNKWNGVPSLTPADYNILYSGNNVVMTDAMPQLSIPPCGQAIDNPPPSPGHHKDGLISCDDCVIINTKDFSNKKLNEATLIAIEKAEENTTGNYIAAINLFSQILMRDYVNPTKDEKYLLNLSYLKMLDALGNAFSSKQLTSQQNATSFDATIEQVISVLNKLIDISANTDDYPGKLMYSLDKAAAYRLADRRDLALDVLLSASNWIKQDDLAELNRFICIYDIENQALLGTIPPEELFNAINSCDAGKGKRDRDLENTYTSKQVEKLNIDIYPNPASTEISLITNVEYGRVILTNAIGQKVYSGDFSRDEIIDVSSFPKGIYALEITDKDSGVKKTQKVVIQ